VFSTSDAGLRYWQVHSLIETQWKTLAIDYPTELDPAYRYAPYYYAYSLIDGQLYFDISPFYPLLASFLYKAVGKIGLVISPIIGAIFTIWGIYKLAILCNLPKPNLMMWATIFATPLLFYSVQVWDHTLGTGLALLGLAYALQGLRQEKRHLIFSGGVILSLAAGQRPELYVLVGAFGFAWTITNWRAYQQSTILIIGGIAGILPIWALQQLWVGHPLGLATATHLLGYGRAVSYLAQPAGHPKSVKIGNFLFHINSGDLPTFFAALAAIIGAGLLFTALRLPKYQNNKTLWVGAILTFIGVAIWSFTALQNMVTGLVSTFSLFGISMAFVSGKKDNPFTHMVYRIIFITLIMYVGVMVVFWPAFGARIWGARYLLTAYPLLIFLAFYNYSVYDKLISLSIRRTFQLIFAFLLIIGVGFHMLGYRFNLSMVNSLASTRDALIELPVEVVITNQPFWPALIGPTSGKTYYYVRSQADLEDLLPKLHDSGVSGFTLVLLADDLLSVPTQINGVRMIESNAFTYYFANEQSD
jgi:hypothetical protein